MPEQPKVIATPEQYSRIQSIKNGTIIRIRVHSIKMSLSFLVCLLFSCTYDDTRFN